MHDAILHFGQTLKAAATMRKKKATKLFACVGFGCLLRTLLLYILPTQTFTLTEWQKEFAGAG